MTLRAGAVTGSVVGGGGSGGGYTRSPEGHGLWPAYGVEGGPDNASVSAWSFVCWVATMMVSARRARSATGTGGVIARDLPMERIHTSELRLTRLACAPLTPCVLPLPATFGDNGPVAKNCGR